MQNKIQVNQVLREFPRYGKLLYVLAAIFFYQTILNIFIYIVVIIFKQDFTNTIFLIDLISDRIITTSILIVVFILMLKAIIIHSKVHEPSIKLFSNFSVLWFIFYIVAQIILWLPIIFSYIVPISINPKLYIALNFMQPAAGILSIISQLIVWISLRKFFLDNDEIFPIKTTKSILNCLLLLIITMWITLLIGVLISLVDYALISVSISFSGTFSPYPPYLGYQQIFGIPSGILSIIGYSLLGYRLGKVKTSLDISIPER